MEYWTFDFFACDVMELGRRDSNPDSVIQSHESYRWTTSQSGHGAVLKMSEYHRVNSLQHEVSTSRVCGLTVGRTSQNKPRKS
jgi:hypothetical protein